MSEKDKELEKKKLNPLLPKDEEETESGEGSGTEGGAGTSSVQFHDFIRVGGAVPDDLLPPDEKRRLLSVHEYNNKNSVEKQRERLKYYADLKENKTNYRQQGFGQGGYESTYKTHPLSQTVQFGSGTDNKINPVPSEHNADTNNEKRAELTYQYQLTYTPENAPKPVFNPKPTYR